MTDDLVTFLRGRLDEDERIARAATWADDANTWHAAPSPYDTWGKNERWYVEDAMEEGVVTHVDPKAADDEGVARHVAWWDPPRVLREIDAKRRIVDECERAVDYDSRGMMSMAEDFLCLLALPYADHPDYRDEWRP